MVGWKGGAMRGQRRAVVTGGAGFLGSHIAEALLADGYLVTVVDSFTDDYNPAIKQANVRELRRTGMPVGVETADLADQAAAAAVVERLRPDVVVHCAARAGVRASVLEPASYVQRNITATVNLVEAMRAVGCRRLVFASSSSVYGDGPVPFTEGGAVLRPASPYGTSKLCAELFLQTAAQLHGLVYVALRFFTVYGPRQRPDMAIHRFASALLTDSPITVHGDGGSWRDYTHVDDAVRGVRAAVGWVSGQVAGQEAVNIGSSSPVLLRDLIGMLEQICGRRARVRHGGAQRGDVNGTLADIGKAQRLLDYQPRRCLYDGLAEFVAWLETHMDVFASAAVGADQGAGALTGPAAVRGFETARWVKEAP